MKNMGRGWIMRVNGAILRTAVYCAMVALFLCGGCSDTDVITAVGGGRRPPSIPTDVVANALSSDSVVVRWSRVPEAIGYYVYRGTPIFTDDGNASDTTYIRWVIGTTTTMVDCNLQPSTMYYYQISAYNRAGEGHKSSIVSVITKPIVSSLPDVPANVAASALSSDTIKITWSYVSGAAGYYVYHSTSALGAYSLLCTDTVTSAIHYRLQPNTTYYYMVSAYNSAGEGSWSSYVSATTQSTEVNTFIDYRDGKAYKRVNMPDGLVWMAENLNYETPSGSWCNDGKSSNCNIYGRLYDWSTARAVCPAGWRLSGHEDWLRLVAVVGGASVAGKKLKATRLWEQSGNGTDDYGFSALPGGYNGEWEYPYNKGIGYIGSWWTAEDRGSNAGVFWMSCENDMVEDGGDKKNSGNSVRCIQN